MRIELYSKFYNKKTKRYHLPVLKGEISVDIETKAPERTNFDRVVYGEYYPDFNRAYAASLLSIHEVKSFCTNHPRAKKVVVFMSNEEHLAVCTSANNQMYKAQRHRADSLSRDVRAYRKAVQACLGASFEEKYFDHFLDQARTEIAEDPREMYTRGTKDSRRREAENPIPDDETLNKLYSEVFENEEAN